MKYWIFFLIGFISVAMPFYFVSSLVNAQLNILTVTDIFHNKNYVVSLSENSSMTLNTLNITGTLYTNTLISNIINSTITNTTSITVTNDVNASRVFQNGVQLSTNTIGGKGTIAYIPLWNGTNTLNNSNIQQSGKNTYISGGLAIKGTRDMSGSGIFMDTDAGQAEIFGFNYTTSTSMPFAFYGANYSMGTFSPGNVGGNGIFIGQSPGSSQPGYVGIGTITPTVSLHILGRTSNNVQLMIEGATAGDYSQLLNFKQAGTNKWQIGTNMYNAGEFDFYKFNSPAGTVMTLTQAGNVGVGTATPNSKLDVVGEVNITGVSGDGTGKVVCIKSNGNLGTCSSVVALDGTCTCG